MLDPHPLTGGITVADNRLTITGSADVTKTLKFEVDGQTAGADLVINAGAQTADRTLNIPVLTGTDTLVTVALGKSQLGLLTSTTANAIAKFSDTAGTIVNSGVTIDGSNNVAGVAALTVGAGLTVSAGTTAVQALTATTGTFSAATGTNLTLASTSATALSCAGGASFGAGVSIAGNISLTGGNREINTGTTDGSDSRFMSFAGGGGANASRGAFINCIGNEFSTVSFQGSFEFVAGFDAGFADANAGSIRFSAGAAERLRLWRSGGLELANGPSSDPGAGIMSATSYRAGGTQVVIARRTGWATATGTATRTTFDAATVTTAQLAERVKALLDDLHSTAGHGLIGT